MKIDVEKLKSYVKALEDVIEEEKAKGRSTDFLDGKLAAFTKVLNGKFEEEV